MESKMSSKTILDQHPSVTIAYTNIEGIPWLFFAKYDTTYPRHSYRNSLNNIGGNPDESKGDKCPEDCLIREVAEEFNPNHPEKVEFGETGEWASHCDIRFLRSEILGNIQPHYDFLFRAKQLPGDPTTRDYTAIFSTFITFLPIEAFECARDNIDQGKRLVTEGLSGYARLDDLIRSENPLLTAHATAHVLNDYFGTNILHPPELSATQIGFARSSYQAYLPDFKYSEKRHKAIFGKSP